MAVISFSNLKGGVGKSTTCAHFVYWLAVKKRKKVAVIDADAQYSTSSWLSSMNSDIPVESIIDADGIAEKIPQLKDTADYLVIDNAANSSEATRMSVLNATVVVIPVTPSGLDLSSATNAIRLVKQMQRDGLPRAGMFLNRAIKNTNLLKEAQELLQQLEAMGVSSFKQVIYQRQVIADAYLQKATVWELKNGKQAAKDYQILFKEFLKMTDE